MKYRFAHLRNTASVNFDLSLFSCKLTFFYHIRKNFTVGIEMIGSNLYNIIQDKRAERQALIQFNLEYSYTIYFLFSVKQNLFLASYIEHKSMEIEKKIRRGDLGYFHFF